MRIRKVILPLVIALALVASIGAAGAWFSDVEEVGQNYYTAGTLNLKVGDNDPCTRSYVIGNIAPGYNIYRLGTPLRATLTNTGTVAGVLTIEFSPIINYENGRTEPEKLVDGTGGDPGKGNGELGDYLWVSYAEVCTTGWGMIATLDKHCCLNTFSGETYADLTTLEPGETVNFQMKLNLPENVDNIVQSDSVEFDITFYLDQVQPYLDQTTGTITP